MIIKKIFTIENIPNSPFQRRKQHLRQSELDKSAFIIKFASITNMDIQNMSSTVLNPLEKTYFGLGPLFLFCWTSKRLVLPYFSIRKTILSLNSYFRFCGFVVLEHFWLAWRLTISCWCLRLVNYGCK